MKKVYLFFSLVLISSFHFSCGSNEVPIPENVLTEKEMIPLLTDIHLAQSAVSLVQLNDSVQHKMNVYTNYILKSKNISREKFNASIAFYSQHPELLEGIYNEVIIELSKLQSETQKK